VRPRIKKAKLALHRESLVELERDELRRAAGGAGDNGMSSPSICITQCGRTMDYRCLGEA